MTLILPEVSGEDIDWVCDLFALPRSAFAGEDGQDPRLPIIKSMEMLDVEACPGSGKTTMLVAKLAILARYWNARQQGICVLSHTNTARREVEKRLSSTSEGQKLLSYPHFIGTIHGFVNEFLAMPWMRSIGIPVELIDDEICLDRRWKSLPQWVRDSLEKVNLDHQVLRYYDSSIDLGTINWGRGVLGKNTATYIAMQAACRRSIESGAHCHGEMFVWAGELLEKVPKAKLWWRARFPLLYLDEVQDNNQTQSELLHRIFMDDARPVVRQRFGDTNQAIYRFPGEKGSATDPFPVAAIRRDIPNSFRFGQSIADLSDPLALLPHGLKGHGGKGPKNEPDKLGRHAIFLFNDTTIQFVLSAYAAYLLSEFSEEELQIGVFKAVGAVHRHEKTDNPPRLVGHYWPQYDNGICGSNPQPTSFTQYLAAGRRLAFESSQSFELVQKLAQALLKLARIANPQVILKLRTREHRQVLELLSASPALSALYLEIVRVICIERHVVSKAEWEERWQHAVAEIGRHIANVSELPDEANEFIAWKGADYGEGGEEKKAADADNLFRYPQDAPKVVVGLGSIHSVKGETHTATLVMDTFFRAHHLKMLKPWLMGAKAGGQNETDTIKDRLKLHYVAATRPARLLCLAMRRDAFTAADIGKLEARGWRVGDVAEAGTTWRS